MKQLKVALIGNPNVGKTSVFNALTGLNQHVGNYPGVTVERKAGTAVLNGGSKAVIVDLPGVYSINPSSKDEEIALNAVFDAHNKDYPDVVVVVAEVENLKRNLLLFTQVKDLGFPAILALNMSDQMDKKGISIDIPALEKALHTRIVLMSARRKHGMDDLKKAIADYASYPAAPLFDLKKVDPDYFESLENAYPGQNLYKIWLSESGVFPFTAGKNSEQYRSEPEKTKLQHRETIKRYQFINDILKNTYTIDTSKATDIRMRFDRILTHRFWGYVIFFLVLMMIYGSIFELAAFPMDFVDGLFASLSAWIGENLPGENLPGGKLTELLAEGVVPGLGGVLMFVPQIAILFFLISILEETGYMSRVVFLMDRVMKPFGLSGKSVVPLVSGTACAIPAIMSARNIENPKERLITMLVTPFTTCSARIPVYIIIISLVVPKTYLLGFIPLQAFVMTLMYVLGFLAALGAGYVLSKIIRADRKSFFIIEMPTYKLPILKNVVLTMYEKTISYILGAGKIILALSVVLWFLGSHGPDSTFGNAERIIGERHFNGNLSEEELANEIAGYRLEHSYIGMIGRTVEPVFRPLGYDWKISIAVLTSFAAREVFVGNLATLYNLGSDVEDEEAKVINRMAFEKRSDGTPVYNLATGVSLLLFYAFAMQCLSTVGVTKKETNSWKWTFFQMVFMTGIAYIFAMAAYQLLK